MLINVTFPCIIFQGFTGESHNKQGYILVAAVRLGNFRAVGDWWATVSFIKGVKPSSQSIGSKPSKRD